MLHILFIKCHLTNWETRTRHNEVKAEPVFSSCQPSLILHTPQYLGPSQVTQSFCHSKNKLREMLVQTTFPQRANSTPENRGNQKHPDGLSLPVYICYPNTKTTGAEMSWIQIQPALHSEALARQLPQRLGGWASWDSNHVPPHSVFQASYYKPGSSGPHGFCCALGMQGQEGPESKPNNGTTVLVSYIRVTHAIKALP